MAPSFARCVLYFSLQSRGESHARALAEDLEAPGWLTHFSHANPLEGKKCSHTWHAVSTRQPIGGQNDAHTPGIHLPHVGGGHSSPEPLPFPQAEPSHRTHHCEDISGCEKSALSSHVCTFTILFPSRSPPHKPSPATEHTIARTSQDARKPHFFACMHIHHFVFAFLCFCLWFVK